MLTFMRIAFVPILMFCNAQPRHHLPVIFDKDYAYVIFIILFAFTNGYLINLCVLHIPRYVFNFFEINLKKYV